LPSRRGLQLGDRDQLALEVMTENAAVANEVVGLSLDLVQLAVVIEHPDDHRVDQQQRRRSDDAARERIVVPDDRVLHRVRQQEQDDEIKRVYLRQLAFPG